MINRGMLTSFGTSPALRQNMANAALNESIPFLFPPLPAYSSAVHIESLRTMIRVVLLVNYPWANLWFDHVQASKLLKKKNAPFHHIAIQTHSL
jgi:hypothetical protein